jgi:hypothetical protein
VQKGFGAEIGLKDAIKNRVFPWTLSERFAETKSEDGRQAKNAAERPETARQRECKFAAFLWVVLGALDRAACAANAGRVDAALVDLVAV